jgi:D-alanine transaminase
MIAYWNGTFLPHEEVRVSPEERGFLFADGVYEVVMTYDGRLFRLHDHLRRLARSLEAVDITGCQSVDFADVARQLVERNRLTGGQAIVYLQVTRGAYPRSHLFPPPTVAPTIYGFAASFHAHEDEHAAGVRVVLVPDTRWARCDIKSIALLPNVLARQRAFDQKAAEALFVRDGMVMEGTHTNLFCVEGGNVRTPPRTNYILGGVTRGVVLELCSDAGIAAEERSIEAAALPGYDELFLAGTTAEITPVVAVDGRVVGTGTPGPVTRQLQRAFAEAVRKPD